MTGRTESESNARPQRQREQRRTRHEAQLSGYETGPDAGPRAAEDGLERSANANVVVLVEGVSDQVAVEALARRRGRDLVAEGIVVLPIGGAQAVPRYVAHFEGLDGVSVLALCDRAEQPVFARAFAESTRLAQVFVCDVDLESELIRAIDRPDLEAVIASQGELAALRTMQKQAAWVDRAFSDQVHRWIRSQARRSARYAKLIVEAAPEDRLPPPLVDLVDAM